MLWEQSIQYGSISDVGFRRRNNQDALIVQVCPDRATWNEHGHLFLISDGMGGHAVGELASKITVDTLPQTFFKSRGSNVAAALQEAIEVANAAVYERGTANHDFQKMGTTCSALVLSPAGAVIGHVGDSRVYRISEDRIDQLTFDHSLQWELIRRREMSPEDVLLHEPRHVITRSLGPEPRVNVDIEGPYPVQLGDIFLLCSDSLTGHVNDAEIGTIARELPPGDACCLLVSLANLRGGSDNVSVVIVRAGEIPPGLHADQDPAQAAREAATSWSWLAAYWAIAIMFLVGVSLTLFEKTTLGTTCAALAMMAILTIIVLRLKKRLRRQPGGETAETVLWKPYRTASARLNLKFLRHLAAVAAELQRTATEEGWLIDWVRHEQASNDAQRAYAARRYSQAFRDYAKVIEALMVGLNQFRKQLHHNVRWGKTPLAPTQKSNGAGGQRDNATGTAGSEGTSMHR